MYNIHYLFGSYVYLCQIVCTTDYSYVQQKRYTCTRIWLTHTIQSSQHYHFGSLFHIFLIYILKALSSIELTVSLNIAPIREMSTDFRSVFHC